MVMGMLGISVALFHSEVFVLLGEVMGSDHGAI